MHSYSSQITKLPKTNCFALCLIFNHNKSTLGCNESEENPAIILTLLQSDRKHWEKTLKRKRRGFDELNTKCARVTEPYKTRKKAEYSRLYRKKPLKLHFYLNYCLNKNISQKQQLSSCKWALVYHELFYTKQNRVKTSVRTWLTHIVISIYMLTTNKRYLL